MDGADKGIDFGNITLAQSFVQLLTVRYDRSTANSRSRPVKGPFRAELRFALDPALSRCVYEKLMVAGIVRILYIESSQDVGKITPPSYRAC